MVRRVSTVFAVVAIAAALTATATGQCVMDWADGFAAPGTAARSWGDVLAMTVFDDGSGPALYIGGRFETVGNTIAQRIARWDGTSWSAVGDGLGGNPYALAAFDDGWEPALYAGTDSGVWKWDGSSWTYVGFNRWVHALAVYDDGSGPALYAGFEYSASGIHGLAKWDGMSWSEVGGGMYPYYFDVAVRALAVYDDGNGPALYVGGRFFKAGGSQGITAHNIARWDGQNWSALSNGTDYDGVYALTVYDDGSGPALYAGGRFSDAGGVETNSVAKWDGTNWSALGTGVDGIGSYQTVSALGVFDDGGGPALYVGGDFELAGGLSVNHVARWDGATWSALGAGVEGALVPAVKALAAYDDGSGPALYVGGDFFAADGVSRPITSPVGDGSEFSALASGNGIGGELYALEVFDDGSGPALYAGGYFFTAGDVVAYGIARWDGSAWSPLGSGTSSEVVDLAVYDDGSGAALYAGGLFFEAGGVDMSGVAKWDGLNWSALGSGVDSLHLRAGRFLMMAAVRRCTRPATSTKRAA